MGVILRGGSGAKNWPSTVLRCPDLGCSNVFVFFCISGRRANTLDLNTKTGPESRSKRALYHLNSPYINEQRDSGEGRLLVHQR